jgi:hypothetical protein
MNNEYVPVTRRRFAKPMDEAGAKFAATYEMNLNKEIERLASEYVEP